jgi:nudix-type nucleoside diphosphatase (YffH/AdpP family)
MMKDKTDSNKILSTEIVYAGWTQLHVATIRLPDGRTIKREIEDHGEAVCVMPYHPLRRTAILVRQPRVPVLFAANLQETLEAIAGVMEETDPVACVHREVMEEALLKLESVEHLFTGWTMPGISTERMHFYAAVYSGEARPDTRGGVDEDESTIAVEIGLAELARMADAGELTDVKTLVLLQTMRLRKPELF